MQFIGGEPTLHPDLAKLIRYSKTCDIPNIEVYTNGTAFTAELQDVFETHNVELAFSIYAEKGHIHDEITRIKGSQEKTLQSIKWAVNKELPVRVGIIKMEANAEHIKATQTMLRNIGVKHVGIDFVRGIGRGKDLVNTEIFDPMKELCGNCAHQRLCVTSTGETYPCVFARFCSLGNATDGLENILNSAQLKTFQTNLQKMHAFGDEDEEDEENYCNPDRSTPCQPDEECGPTIVCHPDGECQPRTCTPKRTGDDDNDY